MNKFNVLQKIMFQHCDAAGIVFYPRYFEMLNAAIERWFEEELGYSFARMHMELKTGIPTAHIETDFKKPSRLGEQINIEINARKIGKSSIECEFSAHGHPNDDLRFLGEVTLVYFSMETGKPLSIPDDMRAELSRFSQPLIQEQEI